MRRTSSLTILAWLAIGLASGPSLLAQRALYVNSGGRAMRLVRKVDIRAPYVFEKGKFVRPEADDGGAPRTYSLQVADEFLPAFVSVRTIKAEFAHFNSNSVRRLDWQFQFTAAFSTAFKLPDLFFVLEFETDDPQRKYYVQEISAKELQQARPISIEMPLPGSGTADKYELHIFSGGLEVFHSGMPRPFIEEAMGKMVAKRLKDLRDAAPKPLTGPMPRYPDKLVGGKLTGRAVLTCVIATDGRPTELAIKDATDPAFGEAALAVMSQWWFVPKVENGQPIASKAELPFDFAPPKA